MTGYRCSLPGLAGFTNVPSLGTKAFWHRFVARASVAALAKGIPAVRSP